MKGIQPGFEVESQFCEEKLELINLFVTIQILYVVEILELRRLHFSLCAFELLFIMGCLEDVT